MAGSVSPIAEAGRDEGDRAAFVRILRPIQVAAAEVETPPPAASSRPTAPGSGESQSVAPIRSPGREWNPPESDGGDRGAVTEPLRAPSSRGSGGQKKIFFGSMPA